MSMLETHYARLLSLWGETHDLQAAENLLDWDQETKMPARGVEGRAKVLATLAALHHEKVCAPALSEAIEGCLALAQPGSVEAAQAAEAHRIVERTRRVPADLTSALAEERSLALAAWQEARDSADFPRFQPFLTRLVALKKEEAAALATASTPYDSLLDLYEPGATAEALAPLFDILRKRLAPIVRAVIDSGIEPDESVAKGNFEYERQRDFGLDVARAIGFDFEAGRLDLSAHPFCISIHAGDTRLTWRRHEDDFRSGLFGILHESGHGLYDQGLPEEWHRTPLGAAVSLGIHESQSRLWENQVGRSHGFWRWALPRLIERFPELAGRTADQLWPALHVIRPSLVRVEADEVTYNLHVLVRFELERALFAGRLDVADLPAAWDDLYEEVLGVRAPDASKGVLQDIHWAMASFGYFPTYTLGTLAAAQLFAAAERDLGPLDDRFARGEFGLLLAWLRNAVHRHGSRLRPAELIERATGSPLSPEPFLARVEALAEDVYGIRAAALS